LLKTDKISADGLADGICEACCTIQDWRRQSGIVQRDLLKKVKSILQLPSTLTPEQAVTMFDRWRWESTWTKFVINSVRVYEFWGYQWWLPFCDFEFIRFWGTLPFQLRLEKRFVRTYVRGLEAKTTRKTPIADTSNHVLGPIIVKALSRLRLRNLARRIRARIEYHRHHFGWYGLIPESDYRRSFHGQENINTYLANQTVKSIIPHSKIPGGLDFLANNAEAKSTSRSMDGR
jgi:asparagine synthase (glutamine-hydrolysing)